ncbi:protein kinase [Actinospica sp. MGRD01-02]|uniref:non-specific serine/threonine protein kinase n=1 Tax=Actinospica acidithermotolerans TaxID=2828514 RepID=A0A941IFS6_9ACTN|nr:serine/threonine-protein kinase [Actinospica acidithermotolerans]MBR7826665.1 protein kinase [Actinospica acidithermotolerans]
MNEQGAVDDNAVEHDYAAIGAEPLEAEDPRRIGAFPINAVLGSGGMGRVYLGLAPEGYAAVKSVLPHLAGDKVFLHHFGQELGNQAKLPSGVSARLLAADLTARPPWFATEYVPGVTLHEAVCLNGGSLPAETLWTLTWELAKSLRAVAARGIVHRDLKPSNVMLTEDGLKLIDFGVARAVDQSSVTATGVAVGTPAYMAPEQAQAVKNLTPAVDIFSLGSMLGFAASGIPAFGEGAGADLFYRIIHQEPDLGTLNELDPELGALVARCLAKDPAKRPSAAELADLVAERFAAADDEGETVLEGAAEPAWPEVIARRIRVRAEFAATAPPSEPAIPVEEETEALALGAVPVPPGPDDVQTIQNADPRAQKGPAGPGSDAGHPGRRKRHVSRKTLALVLPVILVTGTTAALYGLHLAPFTTSSSANSAQGPGNANPGSATATPGHGVSASSTASPGESGKPGVSRSASEPISSANSQDSATGGSNGGSTAGATSSGTTAGTSHSSSGGSSGSGGTSGQSTSDPAVVSFSTPSMLENVGQKNCVEDGGGVTPTSASCTGGSSEGWTAVKESGNTFEIVNQANGDCINGEGDNYATLGLCDAYSGQYWEIGSRTAQGGTLESPAGGCLAYKSGSYVTETCNANDTAQIWFDAGTA